MNPDPDKLLRLNRQAWDTQAGNQQSRWVQPVDSATIDRARSGDWSVILTPTVPVPAAWFGTLKGCPLLCLASGGGQQAPILAAAGAVVTSFDNSPAQLASDRLVADRDNLRITLEQGDMADLSRFDDGVFEVIFHPVANVFCADVRTVWRECFRVLKPGGRLLAGFMNPDYFLFDHEQIEQGGPLQVRFELPFADVEHLSEQQIQARVAQGQALEFSHCLDDQIGGQLEAGFLLAGFYEDRWSDDATPLNRYMPTSMATLAIKPPTA